MLITARGRGKAIDSAREIRSDDGNVNAEGDWTS
jgi:hypothetical protein